MSVRHLTHRRGSASREWRSLEKRAPCARNTKAPSQRAHSGRGQLWAPVGRRRTLLCGDGAAPVGDLLGTDPVARHGARTAGSARGDEEETAKLTRKEEISFYIKITASE